MLRCAIYCRYSTDRQSETSLVDQRRLCERRAVQEGLTVLVAHGDDGVSGTTPVRRRRGGAALVADAQARRFDVLIVEDLSRLSRDSVESEAVVRKLEHLGIRIIGVSDGYDSQLGNMRKAHRGMRALMNEMYLDDLREKTHRGLEGQFSRGYSAGGRAYGYRTAPILSADGLQVLGRRLEVDPEQAQWVVWIYERCGIDGWPARRIAYELNERGVPALRGGTWGVSGLYGGGAPRGLGVLNNETYVGRVHWNRTQWLKDPDSGKRVWRARPPEEWMVDDRPELRIVSDELWRAVRARMERGRHNGGLRGRGPNPRTLFSGLLRCGLCSGPMIAVSARAYGCLARKDRGPSVCAGTSVPRSELDDRLLSVVREELVSPEALAEAQAAIKASLSERRRTMASKIREHRERLAELDGEIQRLVDAIATVGLSPAVATRLRAAESERETLRHAAAASPDLDPTSEANVDRMFAQYRRLVANLQHALEHDRDRARALLQELIGTVRITQQGEQIWAELQQEAERPAVAGGPSLLGVAGAGFEPATFGL